MWETDIHDAKAILDSPLDVWSDSIRLLRVSGLILEAEWRTYNICIVCGDTVIVGIGLSQNFRSGNIRRTSMARGWRLTDRE